MASDEAIDGRVLVLMPTVRDTERTLSMLAEADVVGAACDGMAQLCRELRAGASAVLVTDEVLQADTAGQLAEAMREQPSWSAVPFVVLTREATSRQLSFGIAHGVLNTIVVERPVRTATLLSVVLSALRGRRHQYAIRDAIQAAERQAAELRAQDDQLRRQAAELSEAAVRKDEFLATLAHELRNPLAPIRTGLELLTKAAPPGLSPTLATMDRQLSHMVRLIDDLLDVSRITQGKLELKRERILLRHAIEAAVETSMPVVRAHDHAFNASLPEEDLWIDADLTRIAQVVSNLLNNASKYTPRGGTVSLSVNRACEQVSVEVSDNGIGIPPSRLDDVFTMFSQVNRSLDRTEGGLGIGLALVHRLVSMHGGSVSAYSEGVGKGSRFVVTLPLALRESVIVPKAIDVAPTVIEGARVLVVDDNQDAAELLAEMLEASGHEVRTAGDGAEAIAIAERCLPQMIILDIGLPGMSGYDVARRLRTDQRFAVTLLVALTGWGSKDDKERARNAGFDCHLTKPVSAADIQRVLGMIGQRTEAPPRYGMQI